MDVNKHGDITPTTGEPLGEDHKRRDLGSILDMPLKLITDKSYFNEEGFLVFGFEPIDESLPSTNPDNHIGYPEMEIMVSPSVSRESLDKLKGCNLPTSDSSEAGVRLKRSSERLKAVNNELTKDIIRNAAGLPELNFDIASILAKSTEVDIDIHKHTNHISYVVNQLWRKRMKPDFDHFMTIKASFYSLGFSEGEITSFMAKQPAVYEKALEDMQKGGMTIDMSMAARGLNSLTSYRLVRLEKYLSPIGEFALQFLKDNLKPKKA